MSKNFSSRQGMGTLAGIVGAVSFGFMPVFSKPVLGAGISPSCLLFYRFGLATLMILVLFLRQPHLLKLERRFVPAILLLTLFSCLSAELLVMGYKYMSGGVAGVIHFSYPVFVMVILLLFYKEKIKPSSIVAIGIALLGIYCLGVLGGDSSFVRRGDHTLGIAIVVASGIACACYIVAVNKTQARFLPALTLTFWLLLLSTIYFGIESWIMGSLVPVTDSFVWYNFVGIALIATVAANYLLVYSIMRIGSTYAAILGAVEPATAVILCIIIFSETLNVPILLGIILIFVSVLIVVTRSRPRV